MIAPSAPTKPLTIVAVHGVGNAEPGAILADLSTPLGDLAMSQAPTDPPVVFEREDLLVAGQVYPRVKVQNARLGDESIGEIIEVNWADVLRPESRPLSVCKHLGMMLVGMRNVSVDPRKGNSPTAHGLRRVYWWVIENFGLWAALFCMTVMLLVSSQDSLWRTRSIALGAMGVVAALAWFLKKLIPAYRVGFWWLVPFGLAGVAFGWPALGLGAPKAWTLFATGLYSGSQLAVMGLLVFAGVMTFCAGEEAPSRRAALTGFLWIPFALFTMVLTVVWARLLAWADGFQPDAPIPRYYETWQEWFGETIGYNLWWCEMIMALAMVGIFVVVPTMAVLVYRRPKVRKFLGLPLKEGPAAHAMIGVFLNVGPYLLLAAILECLVVSLPGTPFSREYGTVFEVYAASSVRAVALLGIFVPAFRNILDAAGDVLFHIQPKEAKQSTQGLTGDRLEVLLTALGTRPDPPTVMVMAHSQGTVISAELLSRSRFAVKYLVTCGSPIATLYQPFLYDVPQLPDHYAWINLYREGDYIGGDIDRDGVVSVEIGPGGHGDYWKGKDFIRSLDAMMKVIRRGQGPVRVRDRTDVDAEHGG